MSSALRVRLEQSRDISIEQIPLRVDMSKREVVRRVEVFSEDYEEEKVEISQESFTRTSKSTYRILDL